MNDELYGEVEGGQAEQFWDKHYQGRDQPWSGKANAVLARFTEALPAGPALDLGCGAGSNALWLAQRGWNVTAIDISDNALQQVAARAITAQIAERITLSQHDLGRTFPAGAFDLVYAMYLQSPVTFPRKRVLRNAADAVAPGGLLLTVDHASVAPWSWAEPDTVFPTPQEALAKLELNLKLWHIDFVGAPERIAQGPNGQTASVADTIIALRRLAP